MRILTWHKKVSATCFSYFWRGVPFQYSLWALLHTWLWIQFWVRHLKVDYYSNRHYNSKIFCEKFIPTFHLVFLNWQHISQWVLVKPCIFRKSCSNYWVIFYGFCYTESHFQIEDRKGQYKYCHLQVDHWIGSKKNQTLGLLPVFLCQFSCV